MMQKILNNSGGRCRVDVLRLMAPGLCGLLLTGCALFNPRAADPALEAARVKMMEGAITRDQSVMQPLLAPDFTWREDNAPLDEEPYDFWTRHRLWQEFGGVLKEKPYAKGGLMVAPKESLRDDYTGPRAAWRKVGGEWKLAYFYASLAGSR